MRYHNIEEGVFLKRPNRFIAVVRLKGEESGLSREKYRAVSGIYQSRRPCFFEKSDNPNRKTQYDLIAVQKGNRLINMDSQIPNKVVEEWLLQGNLFGKDARVKAGSFFMEIPGLTFTLKQKKEKFLWK